jgi:hypothetical protein
MQKRAHGARFLLHAQQKRREVFDETFFQKVSALKGAEPLSPRARGETKPRRFFSLTFSLRLLFAKKRWLWNLRTQTNCLLTKNCLSLFLLTK